MTSVAIDTLRYARRPKEAGIAPDQAEALSDAQASESAQNLVTKADMARLETRLTWRLPSGVTVIVGLAVTLIKLA